MNKLFKFSIFALVMGSWQSAFFAGPNFGQQWKEILSKSGLKEVSAEEKVNCPSHNSETYQIWRKDRTVVSPLEREKIARTNFGALAAFRRKRAGFLGLGRFFSRASSDKFVRRFSTPASQSKVKRNGKDKEELFLAGTYIKNADLARKEYLWRSMEACKNFGNLGYYRPRLVFAVSKAALVDMKKKETKRGEIVGVFMENRSKTTDDSLQQKCRGWHNFGANPWAIMPPSSIKVGFNLTPREGVEAMNAAREKAETQRKARRNVAANRIQDAWRTTRAWQKFQKRQETEAERRGAETQRKARRAKRAAASRRGGFTNVNAFGTPFLFTGW